MKASKTARPRPRPQTKPTHEPTLVLPSIAWVGRSGWGGLPPLTDGAGANIWLLRGTEFDVLIDCGSESGNPLRLNRRLRAVGSARHRIGEIWLTHSHTDHSGGALRWQERYPRLRCRLAEIGCDFLQRGDLRLTGVAMDPHSRFIPPRRPIPVREGEVLLCPPWKLTVVALPGHAPDCVGYRGEVDGWDVMFTGDAIIGDQGKVRGNVGWLDGLWLSDAPLYERMLAAATRHPPEVMLPGHGVPHAGATVRRSLRNCLWRLKQVNAIPSAPSMFPFYRNT